MLGQQGVGKSSIANSLLGFDNLAEVGKKKKDRIKLPFAVGHGLRSAILYSVPLAVAFIPFHFHFHFHSVWFLPFCGFVISSLKSISAQGGINKNPRFNFKSTSNR